MAPPGGGVAAAGPSAGVRTNVNAAVPAVGRSGGDAGTAALYIGGLHWWTTDADLEAELCKYGPVKEAKFFAERTNGKSKGYAKVEFYNPASVILCKERMNGHILYGRPCVVSSSLQDVEDLGMARVAKKKKSAVQAPSRSSLVLEIGMGRGEVHISESGSMDSDHLGRGGIGNLGLTGNAGIWVAPPLPPLNPAAIPNLGRMSAGYGGFPSGPAPGAFPEVLPSSFTPILASHPSMGGLAGHQTIYRDDDASYQHYGEGSHKMYSERDLTRRRAFDISVRPETERYERIGGSDIDRELEWLVERERDKERERLRAAMGAREW